MAGGRLGCASSYDVEVSVYTGFPSQPVDAMSTVRVGMLEGITRLSWGRRLLDTSEARIQIAKQGVDCCDLWRKFQPWYNDINIYRDGDLVWRGPVYRMRETRDTFVLEARDLTAWMDKRVPVQFTIDPANDATNIMVTMWAAMVTNFGAFVAGVPNAPEMEYPNLLASLEAIDTGRPVDITLDAWYDLIVRVANYREVFQTLVELAPWIEWTQHGNTIAIRPSATYLTPATARLTADDFSTDIEIVVDGESATNFVKAIGEVYTGVGSETTKTDRYAYRPVTIGGRNMPPLCETVYLPDPTNDVADISKLAQRHVDVNVPPLVYANVPDGSKLTPDAPITMHELWCGARIDIDPGYCWQAGSNAYANQASPGGRLNAVDVDWDGQGESVGISLIPLVLDT